MHLSILNFRPFNFRPSNAWLLLAAALYVSIAGCASPTPPATRPVLPPPIEMPAQPTPVPSLPTPPITVVPPVSTFPAPVERSDLAEPHVALLLPLQSAAFKRAAEAVRDGFVAASESQPFGAQIKVRVYASFDESKDIATLYQSAISNGAIAVAGPLTRAGVATLAGQVKITVPTLALNYVDGISIDNLFFYGLAIEAEARQAAQLAAADKLKSATVITTGSTLSKRLAQAFTTEWIALGGKIADEILFEDAAFLKLLPIEPGNMVFLAAEFDKARAIRPYINAALPIYATSQLFNGSANTLANYDLDNIRFVDMPWVVQPDHPAVMIYPHANPPLAPDMERLYALGIDAYRLLQILYNNSYHINLPLDGVTGQIDLINRQFYREAIPAQIKQGQSQLLPKIKWHRPVFAQP